MRRIPVQCLMAAALMMPLAAFAQSFLDQVQYGDRSAVVTRDQGEKYAVRYQDENGQVNLTSENIRVGFDETFSVALPDGRTAGFESRDGLLLIAQAAAKARLSRDAAGHSAAMKSLNFSQAGNTVRLLSANFDSGAFSAIPDNAVVAQEQEQDQDEHTVSSNPTEPPSNNGHTISSNDPPPVPLQSLPWTLSFAGGFGTPITSAVLGPEQPQKTPGAFEAFFRIPILPVKDHHAGGVGLSLGYGFVRAGVYSNTIAWSTPPSWPNNFITITDTRPGLMVHKIAGVDYTTPRFGQMSLTGGVKLAFGRNRQTFHRNFDTQPYDANGNPITSQDKQTDQYVPGLEWSGVTFPVFGQLNVNTGPYATVFAKFERLVAGQVIKELIFGVSFTLNPQVHH